ncbi:MAG TPA: prolyl oligopeptidase family serine peptidase [Acidobacteriaceae bacterium]|nr:prolyl oligopeptidase family serine peptidase [Acidobacteriaceae bacterium]
MSLRKPALFMTILALSLAVRAQHPAPDGKIHGDNGVTLPPPPVAAVHAVTDAYNGTKVDDPYRWLEDAHSPDTRAWIDEENAYTQQYLSQIHNRPEIVQQLTALERVDEYSMPQIRAGKYFFSKRLADENQASIYIRDGFTGQDQRLIDATKLSADQNTNVSINDISQDGNLLVYGVRQGGADEQSVHLFDVRKRQDLSDVLPSARYSGITMNNDDTGLYYARFTHQGTDVWFHKLGTPASDDQKIFGGEYRGQQLGELDLVSVNISDNHHWLIIAIRHGVPATSEDYLVHDLRQPGFDLTPVVYGLKAHVRLLAVADRFFLLTDYQAPNSRIVEAFPGRGPDAWKTIIPEGHDVIDDASNVGGEFFVSRLHDVKTETTIYSMSGQQTGTLTYPGIGSGSVVRGRPSQTEGFYTFQSFITPETIYRYDTKTGKSDVFFRPNIPFDSSQYEVHQVFYTSRDGTRVPMFIAGKKGLPRNAQTRLLMTGYGGFDLPMLPAFSPDYAWWIEQGGWFALPNLRGGNEYGEAWHKAAMFQNKQNVFDDFFAAAEYLIANHYTSPAHFAIRGRSNGGLLMGAAMTQRPDLFGAIWCGYPLLDMLRYQKFEFGRLWTTEYGNAENAADFPWIRKYSPYQNVHKGAKYPPIMFVTGDSDTRVDPAHARKMAALMQADNGSGNPIILRYDTKGGHSGIGSVDKVIDQQVDQMSFIADRLGVKIE